MDMDVYFMDDNMTRLSFLQDFVLYFVHVMT